MKCYDSWVFDTLARRRLVVQPGAARGELTADTGTDCY